MSLDNAFSIEELQAWADRAARLVPAGSKASSATSSVNRRSTGSRSRSGTRTACSCVPRPVGTDASGEDVTANVATIKAVPERLALGAVEMPEVLRSPRRGVLADLGVRSAEPATGGGGIAPLRQPEELRRRLAPPEGPDGDRQPSALASSPTRSGSSTALRSAPTVASRPTPAASISSGAPASRSIPRSRRFAPSPRCTPSASDGRSTVTTSTTRSTAWSSSSTTSRSSGRSERRARPPLGDRLQVPTRGAHDAARGDPRLDRPDRSGDAVREDDAGRRRRLDRRAGALHNEDQVAAKDVRRATRSSSTRRATSSPRSSRRSSRSARRARCRGSSRSPVRAAANRSSVSKTRKTRTASTPTARRSGWQRIAHFSSRVAMDIEGLGEKRVEEFVGRGFLVDVADIYRLDERVLSELDGFGAISARNLDRGNRRVA